MNINVEMAMNNKRPQFGIDVFTLFDRYSQQSNYPCPIPTYPTIA